MEIYAQLFVNLFNILNICATLANFKFFHRALHAFFVDFCKLYDINQFLQLLRISQLFLLQSSDAVQ